MSSERLEAFVAALRSSLESENWHATLALALTLPDICAAIDIPDVGSQRRYRDWWDKWAQPHFTRPAGADRKPHVSLGSGDAYALRCAYLHAGTDDLGGHKAAEVLSRVCFSQGADIHLVQMMDVLQLDVAQFAHSIVAAVTEWMGSITDPDTDDRFGGLITIVDASNGLGFDGSQFRSA